MADPAHLDTLDPRARVLLMGLTCYLVLLALGLKRLRGAPIPRTQSSVLPSRWDLGFFVLFSTIWVLLGTSFVVAAFLPDGDQPSWRVSGGQLAALDGLLIFYFAIFAVWSAIKAIRVWAWIRAGRPRRSDSARGPHPTNDRPTTP